MSDIPIVGKRPPKVAVLIPCAEYLHAKFCSDLVGMVGATTALVVAGHTNAIRLKDEDGRPLADLAVVFKVGTYVHTARQDLIDQALEGGADYILWLDSDMRFPRNVIPRLMKHDVDIVGINYATRAAIPEFVAIKRITRSHESQSKRCVTGPDQHGLEEVEALGFGCVLIKRQVFEKLHDPKSKKGPWFWYKWLSHLSQQMGEDVYFCQLARRAGFKVYVDHDLSKECAHMGSWTYRLDHAFEVMPEIEEYRRARQAHETKYQQELESAV